MSQFDPKKIEEYQIMLQKNPRSPIFAIVAESYRKMGLLEEALETTSKGILHNPEYVTGLVAHAKILFELKEYREALTHLEKAHALNHENIIALRLLGHCNLKLKKHGTALKAFKKLLLLKPNDQAALKFIQKWEFLENSEFNIQGSDFQQQDIEEWIQNLPTVDKVLNLIDSFIGFEETEVAKDIANIAILSWPQNDELEKRMKLIGMTLKSPNNANNPHLFEVQRKKEFYQRCLQRIEQLKTVDP